MALGSPGPTAKSVGSLCRTITDVLNSTTVSHLAVLFLVSASSVELLLDTREPSRRGWDITNDHYL